MKEKTMTDKESIKFLKERIELINSDYPDVVDYKNALECAIRALEEKQSAFNIDKVVEQLKRDSYEETADDMNAFEPQQVVNLYDAIEIVRGRGIDT